MPYDQAALACVRRIYTHRDRHDYLRPLPDRLRQREEVATLLFHQVSAGLSQLTKTNGRANRIVGNDKEDQERRLLADGPLYG